MPKKHLAVCALRFLVILAVTALAVSIVAFILELTAYTNNTLVFDLRKLIIPSGLLTLISTIGLRFTDRSDKGTRVLARVSFSLVFIAIVLIAVFVYLLSRITF